MRLSDWPAAEAHWRTALTFDIRPWWAYTELAGALEQQGRLAEAEAVLLEGQLRSDEPDEITLHTYAAELAWKREDWAGAVARWAEARRRFPNDENLPARHQEALLRLSQSESLSTEPARGGTGAVPARG
jgi:predicted Zn-dependent protease